MRRAAITLLIGCATASPVEHVASLPSVVVAPPASPLHAELVSFASGARTLHGYLWRPQGVEKAPAVVFSHGSEASPSTGEGQARFFVAHGFVLFVPHRRGQGASRDAGEYIGTLRDDALIAELDEQSDDVMAAVRYVASLPDVDRARIAVTGCSFGGIEALLAAERGTGISAAIDFAGGAMMWARTQALQTRMKSAAANARAPIFFIQAENDFDTTPSRVLYTTAIAAGKRARMRIFPPVGTTHMDGHGFCRGGDNPAWGDDVLAFLRAPTE